jgi:hypothetical protein
MVRDAQRQRVYTAEASVPTGGEWQTIPEVQASVNRLTRRGTGCAEGRLHYTLPSRDGTRASTSV